MNRNERTKVAEQTVAICEAGFYTSPAGARVEVADTLARAKAGTKIYSPENLVAATAPRTKRPTRIEVKNETTFQSLARLSALTTGHLACLNFASAKNPGGGFLNGAIAQEEALASASGLYPCLLKAPEYYSRNRANRSTLYLDLIIFSPCVPFFRNDAGTLLDKPVVASVITAPAPNAGSVAQNEPNNLGKIEPTLRRRAELVLAVAAAEKVDQLVLGAWGCGVFRNDPRMVARIFAELLKTKFAGAFEHVAFAVFDRSESGSTYRAFAETDFRT
ncbi:MAG TPA: TIGR02452 family protein [Verrucomicrobiae bacterium]